jgi:hypothetical protein
MLTSKLLIRFDGKKRMMRFCNFLSAVEDHKLDAKGVIITFSENDIQIVYSHVEEKKEIENYLYFDRENHNYFLFTYHLHQDYQTFTKKIFQNFLYTSDDGLSVNILRMDINDFSSMYKSLSENISNYSRFLIRAKTKGDEKKNNYLRLELFSEGNYVIHDIPMKNSKKTYQPLNPFPNQDSMKITFSFTVLKEIAERFKSMALCNKKDLSNNFMITLKISKENTLYIYFLFNTKCRIIIEIKKKDYEMTENFKLVKYYAVKLVNFINIFNNYDGNNYKSWTRMILFDSQVMFHCYTSECDEQDRKQNSADVYYSEYAMSLHAFIVESKEDYEYILSSLDQD